MRYIDLILFDLDGTLVDSRKDIVRAVNFTLGSLGLPAKPFSEITSFIGTGVKDLLKKSLPRGKRSFLEKSIAIFEKYYRQHAADGTVLYPHVDDVLEYFKKKKMFIITNRRKEMALETLRAFYIDKYFDKVIGGDDDACLKPSACPINKSMDSISSDRKKSIIVGDMDLDIVAGKRAGILTCGVTYGIGNKEAIVKVKPDYLIDDIITLKEIIK
jgi:phosphoglycolate phosphatase